jgi:hypothetical protein
MIEALISGSNTTEDFGKEFSSEKKRTGRWTD